VAEAEKNFNSAPAKILIGFVAGAKRGVCADVGQANNQQDEEQP
jgi:hypothetical protein